MEEITNFAGSLKIGTTTMFIDFERFVLKNGLRVIVHTDHRTPVVALNILYHVGSRDEDSQKTGMAHLFEHLMFEGSLHIPDFDSPLESVGGENNAFTNTDFTNYYLTVPKQNLETAFWLESDRMLGLSFSEEKLQVQKNIVCEEFRQNYLNQPYGDSWLLLRPLAYQVHPYSWSTIGKDTGAIEGITLADVKEFYKTFYNPSNAILAVAGNITTKEVETLCRKWFEPIENKAQPARFLPREPQQQTGRKLQIERDVPFHAIYKAWHICDRFSPEFYPTDLLSDLLAAGQSSRLYKALVKEQRLFSEISAQLTGEIDPGLLVIHGKLVEGVSFEEAEGALQHELEVLVTTPVSENELQKVKNRTESLFAFSSIRALDRAMNLAYYELLGDAGKLNEVMDLYGQVSEKEVMLAARSVLRQENCSSIYYKAARLK